MTMHRWTRSWRERLTAAQRRQPTLTSRLKMSQDADSWQTCAVGEQRHRHPKIVVAMREPDEATVLLTADSRPRDNRLRQLGREFYWALYDAEALDYPEALRILDKIEARVMQLRRLNRHKAKKPAAGGRRPAA